jgi:hypothetical protein
MNNLAQGQIEMIIRILLVSTLVVCGTSGQVFAQEIVASNAASSLVPPAEAATSDAVALQDAASDAQPAATYEESPDATSDMEPLGDLDDLPIESFEHSWYQFDEFPHEEPSGLWWWEPLIDVVEEPLHPMIHSWECLTGNEHVTFESAISNEALEIQEGFPRPPLIFEYPERYLDMKDTMTRGYELPGGAVWRPTLWIWGTNRVAAQYREDQGGANFTELAERLDLFAFLNITGTEHLVFAMRPFDEEEGGQALNGRQFTSYDLNGGGSTSGTNADVQTLFFEGDIGEMIPDMDPWDVNALDYRFSVGRQPMSFQRGLLLNEDLIDAVTVTRNTTNGNGLLNMRTTAVYAWNRITRLAGNASNSNAKMYGVFTEMDFAFNTFNFDIGYLDDDTADGDLLFWGLSSTQRLVGYHNTYNSRFHVLGSHAPDGETRAAGEGTLLFAQTSWTPHHGADLIYFDTFWGIDRFTSPARAPLAGGPLGDTGLLFASAALGRFGPAINNLVNDDVGAALGYQMFFDGRRQQLIAEIGGKRSTKDNNDGIAAIFLRSQTAIQQNWILIGDVFMAKAENTGGRTNQGVRFEVLYQW